MIEVKGYKWIKTLGNQKTRKFNAVHLVEKNSTLYVLKQIQKNADQLLLDCFLNETNFSFESNLLPQLIEFYETETHFYSVFEYKKGIPFNQFLIECSKKQRLHCAKILPAQLTPLLNLIHTAGIIHLDLKPSNLIYNVENDQFHLIDFGMSLRMHTVNRRKTLFSLGYSAPEVVLNQLHLIQPQTDYYSLAAILWQTLSATFPFGHANPSMITNLQITYPFPEIEGVSKKQLVLIRELGYKESFGSPPNQLSAEKIEHVLVKGIEKRTSNLNDFVPRWQDTFNSKKWWNFF